jgi:hypothetical protein
LSLGSDLGILIFLIFGTAIGTKTLILIKKLLSSQGRITQILLDVRIRIQFIFCLVSFVLLMAIFGRFDSSTPFGEEFIHPAMWFNLISSLYFIVMEIKKN